MELLRETAPFLVGLIVPLPVMLLIRASWSGQRKFLASFLPALVYTASQLAYRLYWKPTWETRLQRAVAPGMERVRE